MNGATSQTDITNFRNAGRFYSLSKPDIMVDNWPDNLDSVVAPQQLPPSVTVPTGAYEHERTIAARFYANQFFVMSHDSSIAPEYVHSYRRHCEMNLLAVLRPENWDNQGVIDGMVQGQVGVSDYLVLTPNPIHEYWQNHDDTAWRRGYIRYYLGANAYARDARPLDPANDPVTIPESADARGDDRVSTYTQVVLESEIDRSDATLRAPMHPWTERDAWFEWIETVLGQEETA